MFEALVKRWMKDSKPKNGVLVQGTVISRIFDPARNRPVTDWRRFPNGAATVGLNSLLDVGFRNQTQITAWYIGLIAESGYSALSAADTMASHAGWAELTTYSGNRQAWSPSAASGGTLTISSALAYTTTSNSDIRGIFVASSATKGESASTLWATAVESSPRSITSGQQYQVLYSVSMTPA